MLCSIFTGKSSSNWLDRLRSSRGFPTGSDLDHSLTPRNPTLSDSATALAANPATAHAESKFTSGSPQPDRPNPVLDGPETSSGNGEKDWFGIMSNVLAELFVMGDSNAIPTIRAKKSSRKQANPRYCVHSKSSSVDERFSDDLTRRGEGVSATAPSSGDNSLAEAKGGSFKVKITERGDSDCADDGEEEKLYGDLKEFSRTEVTVIDTSCESWKFDKWLFRRKTVWKVRDKKCKWKNVGKKKRDVASSSDENVVGGGKKPKVTILHFSSLKEAHREEEEPPTVPSCEGPSQHAKREEAGKNTDVVTQVSKRRFPFSRFPRKLSDGGSPLNLVKDDLTSKESGVNIPKSCLKDTQKQCKA